MRQSEKALRDAGWEETTYSDLDKGEEFYLLRTGALLVCKIGVLDTEEAVLRAPRPEPEYELGTIVWGKTTFDMDDPQAFIRVEDPLGYYWLEVIADVDESPDYCRYNQVNVFHVVMYPDGSTPGESAVTDNVTRVEVIDGTGRAYVNTSARDVEVSLQDDCRTLKVFTSGTGSTPRPCESSGQCIPDTDAIIERADARASELLERLCEKLDGKDDTK